MTLALLGRALFLGCMMAAIHAVAGTANQATVLHAFKGVNDGAYPQGVLVQDGQGNFYGTTIGEMDYAGTVFRLAPNGRETVLHSFTGNTDDGVKPVAGVILDAAGNLYGTTEYGGSTRCENAGCGTVYKLAPDGAETILYSFSGAGDGAYPVAPLIMDKKGNLFGTAEGGGSGACSLEGCGTVFEITAKGKFVLLHGFQQSADDGAGPVAPLAFGKNGELIGTTEGGGTINAGTIYEITTNGAFNLLYSFKAHADGAYPYGGVLVDSKGSLYGTTEDGGGTDSGIVYVLAPDGTETVLHSFSLGEDGGTPLSALVTDAKGNLYGTVANGGGRKCYGGSCGAVFRISASGSFKVMSDENKRAGFHTIGGLLIGADGNLYGMASNGGRGCKPFGCGTVYELEP